MIAIIIIPVIYVILSTITPSESEVSADESLSAEAFLESSECASTDSFEDQAESEEVCDSRGGLEPTYLSALSFSFSSSADQLAQRHSLSHLTDGFSSVTCERREDARQAVNSYHEISDIPNSFLFLPCQSREPYECTDGQWDVGLPSGSMSDDHSYACVGNDRVTWLDLNGSQMKVESKMHEIWKTDSSPSSDAIFSLNISPQRASGKNQHFDESFSLGNVSNELFWDSNYDFKFLSTNPKLSKGHFFNYSDKNAERCSMNFREPLSSFDFTSVRDPREVCEEKLAFSPGLQNGAEFPILADTSASDAAKVRGYCTKERCKDENSNQKIKSSCFHSPSNSKSDNCEDTSRGNVTGGSSWETLLDCFRKTPGITANGNRTISATVFEMPLDYVIKKCLWEQILLQYPCGLNICRVKVFL